MASYVGRRRLRDRVRPGGRRRYVRRARPREQRLAATPTASSTLTCPAPDDDVRLGADWALQDPDDYIATFQRAVPAALAESGVDPADVVGVGIDFTACTMLPDDRGRDPALARPRASSRAACLGEALEASRGAAGGGPHQRGREPARRAVARRATAARSRRSGSTRRRSRSSTRRPRSTRAADRLIEAADWVVWQLTGERDAQQLHGRLQGHLVAAGRLSRR